MKLIRETLTTCRTQRQCMDCLQPILPGERKITQVLKNFVGDVWSWIVHDDCHAAAVEFWRELPCEGVDALHWQINAGRAIEDYEDKFPGVAARLRVTFTSRINEGRE